MQTIALAPRNPNFNSHLNNQTHICLMSAIPGQRLEITDAIAAVITTLLGFT